MSRINKRSDDVQGWHCMPTLAASTALVLFRRHLRAQGVRASVLKLRLKAGNAVIATPHVSPHWRCTPARSTVASRQSIAVVLGQLLLAIAFAFRVPLSSF